jgi:methyltransferase (TIGR00027 family)
MRQERGASRTAVLVCQGRAAAHGRLAVDRFDDPTAMDLLRPAERVVVERVRSGDPPPTAWRDRAEFEMVRGCAEVMVPRTVAIDDSVRERRQPQLVILGAGLDGRAFRMPELAAVDAFEVDHPASQQDKLDRARGMQPLAKSLRYVPVDFTRDQLDQALAAAEHQRNLPTTWVWEGVVPYLRRAEVRATLRVISELSASGSRLVVNYQAPAFSAAVGRLLVRSATRLLRARDPLKGEPQRSHWTPAAMNTLLHDVGWTVQRDEDLLTLAEQLSLRATQPRSLRNGRVVVADR